MIPEPELLDHASHWVRAHPATSAVAGGAIVLTVLVVSRGAALALARWRHRRLARHSQVVQLVPHRLSSRAGRWCSGRPWPSCSRQLAAGAGRTATPMSGWSTGGTADA